MVWFISLCGKKWLLLRFKERWIVSFGKIPFSSNHAIVQKLFDGSWPYIPTFLFLTFSCHDSIDSIGLGLRRKAEDHFQKGLCFENFPQIKDEIIGPSYNRNPNHTVYLDDIRSWSCNVRPICTSPRVVWIPCGTFGRIRIIAGSTLKVAVR